MYEREIPCTECQSEKERLEKTGEREVISCEPILGRNGQCKLIYQRSSGLERPDVGGD